MALRKSLKMIAVMLSFCGVAATADEKCNWSPKPDGTKVAVCAESDGRTICKSCPAGGGPCTVVPCR